MGDMADWILENIDRQYIEDPGQIDPPFKGERMAIVKRKLPSGSKPKKKTARVEAGPALDLTLPSERSVPSSRLQDFTQVLFGEKKIGKTVLSSKYPDTLHLMTEPGGKALSIFQRPIDSWKAFRGYVRLLKKDKKFRTVTVDTADLLYKYCFDEVMRKMGLEHPSEETYGKGWNAIRNEFTNGVMELINTGKGIIFISHATEKEIKMRNGETYDRLQPSMSGQAMDILTGVVDLWFYYGYDGHRRTLTIQGSDHIGAGHRLTDHFKYADGTPINEIDMGDNADESYANLLAAFANQLPKPKRVAAAEDEDRPVVKKKTKLSIKRRA